MEYCAGGSVKDVMKECNRKLTEEEISVIIYWVVKGLHYLHSHKFLHRDVKSSNILLSLDGHAKLGMDAFCSLSSFSYCQLFDIYRSYKKPILVYLLN